MGFGIVNKLASRPDIAPSVEEWDAARAREFGLVEVEEEGSIAALVGQMHWLSLACYIEGITPQALALNQDLSQRVNLELKQLHECNQLEAYAASLERLSAQHEQDDVPE
ncbi:MAG: hypothetical protein ACK5Y6_08715 [Pseudomonadota bacterium]|jgi:hypothetical protein